MSTCASTFSRLTYVLFSSFLSSPSSPSNCLYCRPRPNVAPLPRSRALPPAVPTVYDPRDDSHQDVFRWILTRTNARYHTAIIGEGKLSLGTMYIMPAPHYITPHCSSKFNRTILLPLPPSLPPSLAISLSVSKLIVWRISFFVQDVSSTAQQHLLYTRFQSVSHQLAPLLSELERRAASHPDQLSALLQVCFVSTLVLTRFLVAFIPVGAFVGHTPSSCAFFSTSVWLLSVDDEMCYYQCLPICILCVRSRNATRRGLQRGKGSWSEGWWKK